MPDITEPVFKGAFVGPNEEDLGRGRRPVIFDVLAPDQETSLLDAVQDDLRLVLHVNPRTMQFSYAKQITRTQTRGGFVEYHWGDAAEEITFESATGGFMRLYTGLSNITGAGSGTQGRRQTLAYNKYLDLLALFHNNGAIYDAFGNIVLQGYIKMSFDGGIHIGWFDGDFAVSEDANTPYMFTMSGRFIIDREIMRFRSVDLFDFGAQGAVVPGGLDDSDAPDTSTAILDPNVRVGRLETDGNFVGLLGRDELEEDLF